MLNKAAGIASTRALYKVRSITGIRKSGHTGTLDPLADGVLVLCLGKATRLVESVMDCPKIYRTRARLDVTSVSYDLETPCTPVEVDRVPDREAIEACLASFEGWIGQVPPASSAIKVGGRPAYERFRRQEAVELKARTVRVYWNRVRSYAWPTLEFESCVGRGTYIRSMVRDLGARLQTGGTLEGLSRRAVGPFAIEDAHTIEDLQSVADPLSPMIPLEEARAILGASAGHVPPPPEAGGACDRS